MPFELRALEAALEAGVSVLEIAVGNLESIAFPALDSLLLQVHHLFYVYEFSSHQVLELVNGKREGGKAERGGKVP